MQCFINCRTSKLCFIFIWTTNMFNLLWLDKFQKISVYLTATIFFVFALRECIEKYFEHQTARSLEMLKSKDFGLPEITVCLDETMVPEMLKKYGYTSPLSYILGPWQGKLQNVLLLSGTYLKNICLSPNPLLLLSNLAREIRFLICYQSP